MKAPFILRKRDKSDPVRRAGPALQVRKGRSCEVVCATGLRFPANIKLGNPENSGRTFDPRSAVPLGEPPRTGSSTDLKFPDEALSQTTATKMQATLRSLLRLQLDKNARPRGQCQAKSLCRDCATLPTGQPAWTSATCLPTWCLKRCCER